MRGGQNHWTRDRQTSFTRESTRKNPFPFTIPPLSRIKKMNRTGSLESQHSMSIGNPVHSPLSDIFQSSKNVKLMWSIYPLFYIGALFANTHNDFIRGCNEHKNINSYNNPIFWCGQPAILMVQATHTVRV